MSNPTQNTTATLTAKVKRGDASWTYIYVMLALALAFTWTLIQLWGNCAKLLAFLFLTALLLYLFLFNGRFQNRLIGLKAWYESKFR